MIVDQTWAWLAENAVVGAILAVAVLIVCRTLRPRPAVQHLLWVLVIVKLIAPPLVAWPWDVPEWLGRRPDTPTVERSLPVAPHAATPQRGAADAPPARTFVLRRDAPSVPPSETPKPDTRRAAPSQVAEAPASVIPTAARLAMMTERIPLIAVCAWALGAAMMLVWQTARGVRVRRLVRRGESPPDWFNALVHDIAGRLEIRPPAARIAPGSASAFLSGCTRPTLLLSAQLVEQADRTRCQVIIAHELAHLKRRDHWVGALELVGSCLAWWNPVFWYARARARESAELACDAWVVWAFPDWRRVYAETLIDVSELVSSEKAPACAFGARTGAQAAFKRRLAMILHRSVPRRTPLLALGAILLLAAIVLPVWSQETPPPPSPPPAPEAPEPEPPPPAPVTAQPPPEPAPAPIAAAPAPVTTEPIPAPPPAPEARPKPPRERPATSRLAEAMDAKVSIEFDDEHISNIADFLNDYLDVNIVIDWRVVKPPPERHPPSGGPGALAPVVERRTPGEEAAEAVARLYPVGADVPATLFIKKERTPQYVSDGVVSFIKLEDISFRMALMALVRPINLEYSVQPEFIWITSRSNILNEPFTDPEINVPDPDSSEFLKMLDSPISLEFDKEHIGRICEFISDYLGLSIVLDSRVVRPRVERGRDGAPLIAQPTPPPGFEYVTDGILPRVRLSDISCGEALKAMLRSLGLYYSIEDGFVWISTPELIAKESFTELTPESEAARKDDGAIDRFIRMFPGQIDGGYEGIGLSIFLDENKNVAVFQVIPNSPAEKAGVQDGDIILRIDGTPTKGMDLDEVRDLVRGRRGSTVDLTLVRPREDSEAERDTITVRIGRDTIRPQDTIRLYQRSFREGGDMAGESLENFLRSMGETSDDVKDSWEHLLKAMADGGEEVRESLEELLKEREDDLIRLQKTIQELQELTNQRIEELRKRLQEDPAEPTIIRIDPEEASSRVGVYGLPEGTSDVFIVKEVGEDGNLQTDVVVKKREMPSEEAAPADP